MTKNYVATIGLEVHAELATESKMFCGCANDPHHSEVNANICPVCLAHPGTLPVPNREAIAMVLLFGQAVGAKAATYSEFDRKNYFYPDIPKAYQISQYAFPFLTGGSIKGVDLTRVHLEEDTARSLHDQGEGSLVDFNRAGVPLMELVTEPVIHDAQTAGAFARELQLLLRTLKISEAQMEQGEMRVEANISVSQTDSLGTKVEVKNLNSFKSVEGAIDFEIARQIEVLETGGSLTQETRGWDEVKLRTYTQRSKETAKDYRYFPDPDIPKINIKQVGAFEASRLAEMMVVLPSKKRELYANLGLPSSQIELLISHRVLDPYFVTITQLVEAEAVVLKLVANYLLSDVVALLGDATAIDLTPEHFYDLIKLCEEGKINSRVTKDLLADLLFKDADPLALATELGLLQSSDPAALEGVIAAIIAAHPGVVADYQGGKEASLQFLVGQGMRLTKGAANPGLLADLLKTRIKSLL